MRDYIHVNDLADAHVSALERLASGADSIAVNLGTGTGYSVKEVLDKIEQITGHKVPARVAPRGRGIRPRWWRIRNGPERSCTGRQRALWMKS